jgi:hypothetical protein
MCLDKAILRYYSRAAGLFNLVYLAFWPERVCYAYGYAYTKSQPPTGHSDTLWIEWKHP